MHVEATRLPSWLRWETHGHRALIAVAILASAGIAAAASNERRLFLLPDSPMAFTAIAAPEPTALRSAIMGYLDDGCGPDVDGASGGFQRAIDKADCGPGRKRPAPAPAVVEDPAAFFAMPDDPAPFDSPLLYIADLAIDPLPLSVIGGRSGPIRDASLTPAALLGGVPEPATWAMMIGGFALAGGMLRRRPQAEALPQA